MKRFLSVVTVVVTLALVVGSWFGFRKAGSLADDAEVASRSAESYEIVMLYTELNETLLDELNTASLVAIGVLDAAALDAVAQERSATVRRAQEALRGFTSDTAVDQQMQAELESVLTRVAEFDPNVTDYWEYWDVAMLSMDNMEPVAIGQPNLVSLVQLHSIAVSPRIVLGGAIIPAAVRSELTPPDNAREYFDSDAEWLLSGDAGYLGPSEDSPLPPWVEIETSLHPEQAAQVADGLVASGLFEFDAWLSTWGEGDPGNDPMTLDQVRLAAAGLSLRFDALVAPELIAGTAELQREAADARSARSRYRMAAFAALAIVALLILWEVVGQAHRRRQLASAAMTDPLTGVGNRRHLETTVPAGLNNSLFNHHHVGMIDMDRFKMVNDSWGHAAGDAVLVAVADRVNVLLDEWMAAGTHRSAVIIRLGGDEFLVALHSANPVDLEKFAHDLRLAVEEPLHFEGNLIPIEISLGFSVCDSAEQLTSAMAAADLAAYEEKGRSRQLVQQADERVGQR